MIFFAHNNSNNTSTITSTCPCTVPYSFRIPSTVRRISSKRKTYTEDWIDNSLLVQAFPVWFCFYFRGTNRTVANISRTARSVAAAYRTGVNACPLTDSVFSVISNVFFPVVVVVVVVVADDDDDRRETSEEDTEDKKKRTREDRRGVVVVAKNSVFPARKPVFATTVRMRSLLSLVPSSASLLLFFLWIAQHQG